MKVRRIFLWGVAAVLLAGGGAAYWLFADLPTPETLTARASAPSSKIVDRYGRLLFEMPPPEGGSHTPVPLSEVPVALRQATIATEDASFYENRGWDARAILRALWIDLRGGEVLSGGSTITQQLVRNVLLPPEERTEVSLRRKLRELYLAVRLTQRYSKDEILAFYLNETYYGNLAYGVEAAAQAYFGKHVRDLDLAECAMLAGLPQAPVAYNPLEHLPKARTRQAVVLGLMVKQGTITAAEARRAQEEPLYFAAAPFPIHAPHFVMYVRGFLEQTLGRETLEAGGLTITTTLDLDLNEAALALMREHLARLADCNHAPDCPPQGHNVRNAALVAIDPRHGEVLAMVGSPDYFSARISGAVNGATALRQPGSAIKPLTYAAAFAGGKFTPASVLVDERTSFLTREGKPYVPLNYDLRFRGPVSLREALASSYNVIAVKVLDAIGVETMTSLARRMGITTFDDPDRLGLAVTLGGGEVRLLELTAAYGAFANGGRKVTPVVVRQVRDASGREVWAAPEGVGAQVLDPRVAYLITDILSDDLARIPTFGEGSVLNIGRPAAVKTGTTTNFRDNWTVGYTPALVVGVWAGNADNEVMRDVTGVSGAAPLWHDFMVAALKGTPVQQFPRPAGLVRERVCADTGLLPGPSCTHQVDELFIAGTQPTRTAEVALPAPGAALPEARFRISHPDQGASYRIDPTLPRAAQRIVVEAEVPPGMKVAQLTLLVDRSPLAQLTAPPYRAWWTLTPGTHHFAAIARTAEGDEVRTPEVQVGVSLPPP